MQMRQRWEGQGRRSPGRYFPVSFAASFAASVAGYFFVSIASRAGALSLSAFLLEDISDLAWSSSPFAAISSWTSLSFFRPAMTAVAVFSYSVRLNQEATQTYST